MKGNAKIIEALNGVLCKELTAINQYFLHARMLQNWGLAHLGKLEYEASIDEMKHADAIIKRILFLEGLPNVQKLERIMVGQNVKEIIKSDLKVENTAIPFLKKCIQLCEKDGDFGSRELLIDILKSEEEHVDWLEVQEGLLEKVGLENFIQSQMEPEKFPS